MTTIQRATFFLAVMALCALAAQSLASRIDPQFARISHALIGGE